MKTRRIEADVAIAGAGPGGCTVARELARAGRRVVLLEKGQHDRRFFGTPLGILAHVETERSLNLIRRTEQGDDLIMGHGVGGGTLVFAGAAFAPDRGYWKRHGIHIPDGLVEEASEQCHVARAPEEFIGPGTRRIWDAARELGLPWDRLPRFVDFDRCTPGCEKCIEGCPTGAKWTAASFADDAVDAGAILMTRTAVERVLVEHGAACGLMAHTRSGQVIVVEAKAVVSSAGAVGTARLLKGSGLDEAGGWLFGDPTVISVGFLKRGKGNAFEHTMPVGHHDGERGLAFASCLQPNLGWHLQMLQSSGLGALGRMLSFRRAVGVFCKVADEERGSVSADGRVSKTWTRRDLERREQGHRTAERILERAGCDPGDIHHGKVTLGHPCGTVRVGKLLDTNLETPIEKLYCCDTSVLPEAPGIPPALTIVVLAKRLSRHLMEVT